MKKLLLFFAATIFSVASATAQCTPDPQYTQPGVYPDSATGFDDACVGIAYEQLITIVVPVDTTVIIGGFPVPLSFDSAVVVSVNGLPTGFTYSCYDAGNTTSPVDQCAFEGGTTGCVSIVGTAIAGDIGNHPLTITVDAYVGGATSPQTQIVDYYSIEVLDQNDPNCTASVFEIFADKYILYPNPANEQVTIKGIEGSATIEVYNTSGMVVANFNHTSGNFDMNIGELENGLYFVQIRQEGTIETVRFIKE